MCCALKYLYLQRYPHHNKHCCNFYAPTVDCGAPQPPANGFIKTVSSTILGAVISFQCDQGFSPPEERTATCARDEDTGSAVWEPNPAEHTCSRNDTGTITTTTASMYFRIFRNYILALVAKLLMPNVQEVTVMKLFFSITLTVL